MSRTVISLIIFGSSRLVVFLLGGAVTGRRQVTEDSDGNFIESKVKIGVGLKMK